LAAVYGELDGIGWSTKRTRPSLLGVFFLHDSKTTAFFGGDMKILTTGKLHL
jgi:hypothetical protein